MSSVFEISAKYVNYPIDLLIRCCPKKNILCNHEGELNRVIRSERHFTKQVSCAFLHKDWNIISSQSLITLSWSVHLYWYYWFYSYKKWTKQIFSAVDFLMRRLGIFDAWTMTVWFDKLLTQLVQAPRWKYFWKACFLIKYFKLHCINFPIQTKQKGCILDDDTDQLEKFLMFLTWTTLSFSDLLIPIKINCIYRAQNTLCLQIPLIT